MSNAKQIKSRWGGARDGAGRGAGDKTKICVSVDEDNWQIALSKWKKRPSWLVDALISDYIDGCERGAA